MDVVQRPSQLAPYARGLLEAVLGESGKEAAQAETVLSRAAALGVDPLDYCARRLGLGEQTVMERAAHWAEFAYSPVVPRSAHPAEPIERLDQLAGIRTFRSSLLDRDVTFCTPQFEDLLRLSQARAGDPDLARRICIVPARALRARLADTASRQLMTEARQRLTRRWPYASADVDLPRSVRIAFLAAFALVMVAVGAAPFYLSAVLFPVVAVLLLVPAGLRFAAAFAPERDSPPAPLLSDADLPVYSVLIPLRDEAGMVPLLGRAMSALDYPCRDGRR